MTRGLPEADEAPATSPTLIAPDIIERLRQGRFVPVRASEDRRKITEPPNPFAPHAAPAPPEAISRTDRRDPYTPLAIVKRCIRYEPRVFVNRTDDLLTLAEGLNNPGKKILLIAGPQGNGKTTLARGVLEMMGSGPEQALWFDVSAHTDVESLIQFITQFARALATYAEVPPPPELSPTLSLYETLSLWLAQMQHIPLLMVIDNVEYLVTARERLNSQPLKMLLNVLLSAPQVKLLLLGERLPLNDLAAMQDWVLMMELEGLSIQDTLAWMHHKLRTGQSILRTRMLTPSEMNAPWEEYPWLQKEHLQQWYTQTGGAPWLIRALNYFAQKRPELLRRVMMPLIQHPSQHLTGLSRTDLLSNEAYQNDLLQEALLKAIWPEISENERRGIILLALMRHGLTLDALEQLAEQSLTLGKPPALPTHEDDGFQPVLPQKLNQWVARPFLKVSYPPQHLLEQVRQSHQRYREQRLGEASRGTNPFQNASVAFPALIEQPQEPSLELYRDLKDTVYSLLPAKEQLRGHLVLSVFYGRERQKDLQDRLYPVSERVLRLEMQHHEAMAEALKNTIEAGLEEDLLEGLNTPLTDPLFHDPAWDTPLPTEWDPLREVDSDTAEPPTFSTMQPGIMPRPAGGTPPSIQPLQSPWQAPYTPPPSPAEKRPSRQEDSLSRMLTQEAEAFWSSEYRTRAQALPQDSPPAAEPHAGSATTPTTEPQDSTAASQKPFPLAALEKLHHLLQSQYGDHAPEFPAPSHTTLHALRENLHRVQNAEHLAAVSQQTNFFLNLAMLLQLECTHTQPTTASSSATPSTHGVTELTPTRHPRLSKWINWVETALPPVVSWMDHHNQATPPSIPNFSPGHMPTLTLHPAYGKLVLQGAKATLQTVQYDHTLQYCQTLFQQAKKFQPLLDQWVSRHAQLHGMAQPNTSTNEAPALALFFKDIQATDWPLLEIQAHWLLCDLTSKRSQYDQAFAHAQQAYALTQTISTELQPVSASDSLFRLGQLSEACQRPQEALSYYQQSLQLDEALGEALSCAATLTNMGSLYLEMNQPEETLKCWMASYRYDHRAGNTEGEWNTLMAIADVYQQMGRFDQALKGYQRALALAGTIAQRHPQRKRYLGWQATTQLKLGDLLWKKLSRLPDAMQAYQEASRLAPQVFSGQSQESLNRRVSALRQEISRRG